MKRVPLNHSQQVALMRAIRNGQGFSYLNNGCLKIHEPASDRVVAKQLNSRLAGNVGRRKGKVKARTSWNTKDNGDRSFS